MPRQIPWHRQRVPEEEEDVERLEKLSEGIRESSKNKLAEDLAEAESSVVLLERNLLESLESSGVKVLERKSEQRRSLLRKLLQRRRSPRKSLIWQQFANRESLLSERESQRCEQRNWQGLVLLKLVLLDWKSSVKSKLLNANA